MSRTKKLQHNKCCREKGFPSLSAGVFAAASGFYTCYLAFNGWGLGFVSPYKFSDAALYLYSAWFRAFVSPAGGTLSSIISPSPYVWLQALTYKLVDPHIVTPFICNVALFAAAAGCIAAVSANLFNRRTGWYGGLIFILCGPLVFYTGLTMKTASMVFLLSLSLLLLERSLIKKTPVYFLSLSATVALLALERNNFLLAILLLPLVACVHSRTRHRILYGSLLIIPAMVILAASTIANQNKPYASPVYLNLYIGNSAIATGAYVKVPGIRNDLVGQRNAIVNANVGTNHNYWLNRMWDDIEAEPLHFFTVTAKKALMLVARDVPGSPEQYALWRWHKPVLSIAIFDYGLILSLAIFGIARARAHHTSVALNVFCFIPIGYALTVIPFFIVERYRFPIMIMLIPFAAYTFHWIWHSSVTFRKAGVIAALLAGYISMALLNNINPVGPGWPADWQAKRNWVSAEISAREPCMHCDTKRFVRAHTATGSPWENTMQRSDFGMM